MKSISTKSSTTLDFKENRPEKIASVLVFLVEHRGIEPLTSGLQILAAMVIGITGLRLTWGNAARVHLSKLAISGECPARCPAGFCQLDLRLFFYWVALCAFQIITPSYMNDPSSINCCTFFQIVWSRKMHGKI